MSDLFDYCAEPLRELITYGDISQEVGELFLGFLAVAIPILALVFFIWSVCLLLNAFLGVGGGKG